MNSFKLKEKSAKSWSRYNAFFHLLVMQSRISCIYISHHSMISLEPSDQIAINPSIRTVFTPTAIETKATRPSRQNWNTEASGTESKWKDRRIHSPLLLRIYRLLQLNNRCASIRTSSAGGRSLWCSGWCTLFLPKPVHFFDVLYCLVVFYLLCRVWCLMMFVVRVLCASYITVQYLARYRGSTCGTSFLFRRSRSRLGDF